MSPPCCPREHRGWDHPLPLDRIPAQYGGGWSCPGITPDGEDCGYQLGVAREPAVTPAEQAGRWLAANRETVHSALLAAATALDLTGYRCRDCGCPDPQCGDSTWDHLCEAQRVCPAHRDNAGRARQFRAAATGLAGLPAVPP